MAFGDGTKEAVKALEEAGQIPLLVEDKVRTTNPLSISAWLGR